MIDKEMAEDFTLQKSISCVVSKAIPSTYPL